MKIPFMMFIEPFNLGGSLYFVYSKDEENNCNCLNMQRDENNEVFFTGCDLAEAYLMEECEELSHLSAHTIEYLKKVFEMQGYNPEFLGEQVDSLDKLEDIKVHEFENMAKIRESIKIKDDGTLDYDAMTEEEKEKFFKDLFQLYRADAAVFDGAADDGEELNDLKIDRWNESLNLNNIDVDKTSDDIRRDYLNEGRTSSIKKIHTWVPGEIREKKFNRYTEEVIPVLDHNDTNRYIRSLNLIKSRPLTEKAPEKEDKLEESTANFASNDGDFPIVAWFVDEMYSMKCPNCGYIIYDDPDHNGIRYCDDCGYEASPEEWEKNKEYDNDAVEIFWDDCMDNFERVYSEFKMDDLKYWQVRPKDGYYEGVQALVEDTEYSIEDDMYYQSDIEDFLLDDNIKRYGIDVSAFKKYLEDINFDGYEDYHMSTAFEDFLKEYPVEGIKRIEDIFSLIDEENRGEEAKKINDFLDYLVKDCGWIKIEKVATLSNGEAVYRKVEKKAKESNRIKEARLQEGPGAGYDVEFLGIKITNVKIDEIKLDDYNCQYVEFEADIVPGEYDWNAEGYDWRVDGNSDYSVVFYEKASISGGKVRGTCQNGYQAWADANATWTIDEFVKEIEGESYDLGVMYGGGWSHSDITSPFEMEDEYGIDQSDERSGYKNSYISTASIELEDPGMLNQIIEDTRYSDYYEDEEEEEDLEESKKTKIKEFFGGEWAEPEDDENLENLDTDDYDDEEDDKEDYEGTVSEDLEELKYLLDKQKARMILDSYELRVLQSLIRDYPDEYEEYGSFDAGHAEEWMERNPYGYYNSEEDYGSDWEDDEDDDEEEDDTRPTDDNISDEETAQYEEDMYELNYLLDKSRSSGLDRRELRNLQDLIDIYGYPEDRNYIEGLDEEDYYNDEDYDSLSESSKFKTIKVKFYTYAASYFVNGDSSGLSDEDLEECDFFEDLFKKEFKTKYFDCVDALDDEDFGYPELPLGYLLRENTKGHEFLRGDVCTYVFMV